MPDKDQSPLGDAPGVAILGAGQMGLVCSQLLSAQKEAGLRARRVTILARSEEQADALIQTRRSSRLDDFVLPSEVRVTTRPADALAGADLIVSAVPAQFMRETWASIRREVPTRACVVSVAKGIETGTLLRPTQVVADALADDPDSPARPIGVLSGPTIAAELCRCLPATMIAASDAPDLAVSLQHLFSTSWLRVYTNTDMLGVELAGATKNVIAIAAGILDGLSAGSNAKSALLARGLAEIARLGEAMGASPATFFGIAGVGDLATTCFSPEGRNRSCGEALGRGQSLDEYLAHTSSVVEGVATTKSVLDLARRYRVSMPITESVYAVLFEKMDPLEGITRLMNRELKSERPDENEDQAHTP